MNYSLSERVEFRGSPHEHEQMRTNEEEYIKKIRSSIKKSKVLLKRSSLKAGVNSYNEQLFEENIDIQYILDPYACASYLVKYVCKVDVGMNKFLRQQQRTNQRRSSMKEAAYHVLSLPLSKSSRSTTYEGVTILNPIEYCAR